MAWVYSGRILQTVSEMLRDRGFRDEEETDGDIADTVHISRWRGDAGIAIVIAATKPRVGVRVVRALAEELQSERAALLLLLVDGTLTHSAKSELAAVASLEAFCAEELRYNVTKHELVPPHRRVEGEEWEKLVAEVPSVSRESLPTISVDDPVVRYFGWPPGTVVRIDRRLGEQQQYPYFRVVV